MKRMLLIAFCLLLHGTVAFAQQEGKHNFEIGGGINAFGIPGGCGGPSMDAGMGLYVEYRYNTKEWLDLGLQANFKHGKGRSAFIGGDEPTWGFVDNQIGLKAVADVKMLPKRVVSPYIGIGLGKGVIFTKREAKDNSTGTYGILGPRIGLQIWRIRVFVEYDFATDGFFDFSNRESSLGLNIGYTF